MRALSRLRPPLSHALPHTTKQTPPDASRFTIINPTLACLDTAPSPPTHTHRKSGDEEILGRESSCGAPGSLFDRVGAQLTSRGIYTYIHIYIYTYIYRHLQSFHNLLFPTVVCCSNDSFHECLVPRTSLTAFIVCFAPPMLASTNLFIRVWSPPRTHITASDG